MEYRSLESESFERIHQCFNEAFSDYTVQIQLPFEKFQRNMKRNGVDLRVSIGLYDEEDLVGFILNGVGMWNNLPTVYDSGTGIIKEYRGKKYSKKMFEVLKQKVEREFSQYLLEVIQTNVAAYTLYSHQGFTVERELLCFMVNKESLTKKAEPDFDFHFEKIVSPDWSTVQIFWNSKPSWQNSADAVERVSDQLEKIGVFSGDECIGYGIFGLQSGEIVQMAVKRTMRKKGIGSQLLHQISQETESLHLRIINVDKKDEETVHFLMNNNFVNDINQYEMILNLK